MWVSVVGRRSEVRVIMRELGSYRTDVFSCGSVGAPVSLTQSSVGMEF